MSPTTTYLVLAAGLLVVCWLMVGVRRVQPGQWMVAHRAGVVRRVYTSGLAWRLPFVEQFGQDLTEPHDLPLGVRATTRDGVPILVLTEVTVSIPRPKPGERYVDPWDAAELVAEETIARSVAGWSAAELTQSAVMTQRPIRRALRAAVDGLGVEVLDLELVEVDVQLADQLDPLDRRGPE
jgi:regulator of protease activity HflC (stomatin/prohibitin superfamily)